MVLMLDILSKVARSQETEANSDLIHPRLNIQCAGETGVIGIGRGQHVQSLDLFSGHLSGPRVKGFVNDTRAVPTVMREHVAAKRLGPRSERVVLLGTGDIDLHFGLVQEVYQRSADGTAQSVHHAVVTLQVDRHSGRFYGWGLVSGPERGISGEASESTRAEPEFAL